MIAQLIWDSHGFFNGNHYRGRISFYFRCFEEIEKNICSSYDLVFHMFHLRSYTRVVLVVIPLGFSVPHNTSRNIYGRPRKSMHPFSRNALDQDLHSGRWICSFSKCQSTPAHAYGHYVLLQRYSSEFGNLPVILRSGRDRR